MINKKIFLKLFLSCLIFIIPFLVFAQSGEDDKQLYIDKMLNIQQNISYKINNPIPNFTYINESYRNNLINEFQTYNASLDDFENIINNGICTSYIDNNFLIKRAIAGDAGGTCEIVDPAEYFNERIKGYISLTKKVFIYNSCNDLLALIQSNFLLLNSTQSFIQNFNLQNADDLIQSLLDNANDLSALVDEISNLIINVDSTSYENYDVISLLRQQFLKQDYSAFVTSYIAISNQIISDTQQAIALSKQVSSELSNITPNIDHFYNDKKVIINVLVNDYQNRLLSGFDVQLFAYQDGKSIGISISPSIVETDYQGNASFELTAENAGDVDFKAIVNNIEITANNIVNVIQTASSDNSNISSNPGIVDVNIQSQIVVTIRDVYNNIIENEQVICYAIGSSALVTINPISGITDNKGQVSFQVSSGEAGNISLIARIRGVEIIAENIVQVIQSISPEEQECIDGGGTWDGQECICPDGKEWNDVTKQCEAIISPEEQECIDGGGTWIGEECVCEKGYEWNSKTKQCEIVKK